MSALDIITSTARGWGRPPEQTLVGLVQHGPSAALWSSHQNGRVEVFGERHEARHTLCFQLNGFKGESWNDDRLFFSGETRRGSCNIVLAGQRPRAVLTGKFRILHVYLPTNFVWRAAELLSQATEQDAIELIDPGARPAPALSRFARDILVEMREGSAVSRLRIDVLGQELAVALLRHHSNLSGTRVARSLPKIGGLASWQLKRACEAMLDRLDEDVGLNDLAAIAGCSPTHFSRAFKQSIGIAPFHWLQEQRVEKAKALLVEGRLSLAEIALATGFSAQPQFTTSFGRATGVTPGRWRRERLS